MPEVSSPGQEVERNIGLLRGLRAAAAQNPAVATDVAAGGPDSSREHNQGIELDYEGRKVAVMVTAIRVPAPRVDVMLYVSIVVLGKAPNRPEDQLCKRFLSVLFEQSSECRAWREIPGSRRDPSRCFVGRLPRVEGPVVS